MPRLQPRPIVIDSDLRILDEKNIRLEKPVIFTCIGDDDESHEAVEVEVQGGTRTVGKWKLASEKLQAMGRPFQGKQGLIWALRYERMSPSMPVSIGHEVRAD